MRARVGQIWTNGTYCYAIISIEGEIVTYSYSPTPERMSYLNSLPGRPAAHGTAQTNLHVFDDPCFVLYKPPSLQDWLDIL